MEASTFIVLRFSQSTKKKYEIVNIPSIFVKVTQNAGVAKQIINSWLLSPNA